MSKRAEWAEPAVSSLFPFPWTYLQVALVGALWLFLFLAGSVALFTTTHLTTSAGWRTAIWRAWFAVQPFGLSAVVVGWPAGVGSVPVIGAVLPATIALGTGLAAAPFAKDIATRLFAGFVAPLVSMGLLLGCIGGSNQRAAAIAEWETAFFSDNTKAILIERGAWLAEIEDGTRLPREALGLPNATGPAIGLEWLIRRQCPETAAILVIEG